MWTGEHTILVRADPHAIWERWTRLDLWAEDDPKTKWAKLDGPLQVGATGQLKPTQGPVSKLTITRLDQPNQFDCELHVPISTMRFEHRMEPAGDGQVRLTHRVVITGPLAGLYGLLFGRSIVAGLPDVMGNLARIVSGDQSAVQPAGPVAGAK